MWKDQIFNSRINIPLYIKFLVIFAFCVILILPLLYLFGTSLKTNEDLLSIPPTIFSRSLYFRNYADVISKWDYVYSLFVTLLISILNSCGNLIVSLMAAFAFTYIKWPWREKIFNFSLITIMVPSVLTMVPLLILWNRFDLIHAEPSIIIPETIYGFKYMNLLLNMFYSTIPLWLIGWGGCIYDIFLLRQFFRTIPKEIIDAAEIDGANPLQIFSQIILPLSRPILIIIILFRVVFVWHDLLGPLLYLTGDSRKIFTLSQTLSRMQGPLLNVPPWQYISAYSILMIIPLIIIFVLFQQYLFKGFRLKDFQRE